VALLWEGVAAMRLIAFTAFASFIACVTAQTPTTRDVTVNITVEAPAGTPVEGLSLGLSLSRPSAVGKTSSAGQLQLAGTIPLDSQRLTVSLMSRSTQLAQAGSVAEENRYHALLDAHAFFRSYEIDLTAESTYSVSIVGQPAVNVTGQLSWVGDAPSECFAQATNVVMRDHVFGSTDAFEIKGVRKSAPAELYIYGQDRQRVVVVSLSAEQTTSTVNLGIVPGPERTQGRPVALTMLRATEVNGTAIGLWDRSDGGTVVREDGSAVYWGSNSGGTGSLSTLEHQDGVLRLPPGSYFCMPGYLAGSHTHASRLLSLLKAGRANEVEAALKKVGVSKLVVPDDGGSKPVSYSFDAIAAETAIKSVH
jgi:hypothetical protein